MGGLGITRADVMTKHINVAPHCPACTNAQQQGQSLICTKFNVVATPRTSQDCCDFEREPGSDDKTMAWFDGAWHVAGEGRGD